MQIFWLDFENLYRIESIFYPVRICVNIFFRRILIIGQKRKTERKML